jgi:hypothetical protein
MPRAHRGSEWYILFRMSESIDYLVVAAIIPADPVRVCCCTLPKIPLGVTSASWCRAHDAILRLAHKNSPRFGWRKRGIRRMVIAAMDDAASQGHCRVA